jgi:hypothetical protein
MLINCVQPLLLALMVLSVGSVQAMQALTEEQLGAVSGAGIGFFVDGFLYEQGAPATAQISGIKDSVGNAVTIDVTRAYIKGEGSRRGQDDVLGSLGSPLHPFRLGPISLPGGKQVLQLKTPTYTDPLNDTRQYGLWASYQGCVYGEAGCTDATSAVNKITLENTALAANRLALETTYSSNFAGLKTGIDQDLVTVNQRQTVLNTKLADVTVSQASMASAYTNVPNNYIGWSKPELGRKYECGLCLFTPASIDTYNARVDAWNTDQTEAVDAQTSLSNAWLVERNGVTLTQRKFDYDKYAALCGTPTVAGCAGGSVARGQANFIIVNGVATAINNGGTQVAGLDVGMETRFTLPSVAYNSSGVAGASSSRSDFFNLYVHGLRLQGAYVNLWGGAAGLEGEISLQAYADRLALDGCEPGRCFEANRAIAKNVYFDINLGNATYQPLSFKVDSNGHANLALPKVTWANHEAFYQNVQKSNITIGNLSFGNGTSNASGPTPVSLGSQTIQGMRFGYFDFTTSNLPR